ncbi:kinesin-like protein KIN-14N isoform X2 [Phoenix dactylifera]|uniref:Kinesin-like protein KIN-14N isoform X2 n=1 Tax=Phoenix dactylifera TaxID=42345 RepID=A0A8B9AAG0_PHODC|nr:kinesin-like protein KIN-14N isoform X2 [Phoenix dactylifera]
MSSRNQNRPPPTPVFDPTPSPSNVREDVERLLGEKMKGKNQNDYKGKSEQMIEYIKKLRTCIRWFMELEDGYLADQEKLRSMLDSEEKRHAEIDLKNDRPSLNLMRRKERQGLQLKICGQNYPKSWKRFFDYEVSHKTVAIMRQFFNGPWLSWREVSAHAKVGMLHYDCFCLR